MKKLKIFIIAGEVSGDMLGAKLISALRLQYKGIIEFAGVGGDLMTKQGIASLFKMSEISLMGFFEVIPHIFKIRRLIKLTASAIEKFKPDIVVTIDSPGFSMRVVKQTNWQAKYVHYVAPSVWAYKPKRAVVMKKYYDLVLALLPFEPPYFTKIGLACKFVGHSIIEDKWDEATGSVFRKKYNIADKEVIIGVMCGSRKGEVAKLLLIFLDAIKKSGQKALWVFPTVSEELASYIDQILLGSGISYIVPVNESNKIDMFKSMNYAIVKSGTSSLELALARVPMLVAYKLNSFTAWLLRHIYNFKSFASIVNILAEKEIIPEYLQENCNSDTIAVGLNNLIKDHGKTQLAECGKIIDKLRPSDNMSPSETAAKEILLLLDNKVKKT